MSAAAASAEQPAPKKNSKKLFIIIGVVVVLLLGGGGAGFMIWKKKAAEAEAAAAEEGGEEAHAAAKPKPAKRDPKLPPEDSGILGPDIAPDNLTVTVGLGPGVFDDRFDLADKRPALLQPLPRIPGDTLKPELTGGDLSIQACADDPQVAYHAVRNLARMVTSTAQTPIGTGFSSTVRQLASTASPTLT